MAHQGYGNNQFEASSEIYIKKVLVGDVEDVRRRVIGAVETLGYDTVEEEPNIIGRREGKDWGAWGGSANVLDGPMTVTIRLKKITEYTTSVTFDYLTKSPWLLKNDRDLIQQEAKTIAAISKKQAIEKLCSICETESTDDSRFCRGCGAPLISEQTEIEVLRLMGETRAGKSSVVFSAFLVPISVAFLVLIFILNNADLIKTKLFPFLLVIGGFGLLLGIISNFFGWNRLKRAMEKPKTETANVSHHVPELIEKGDVRELPPQRVAPASVTEGTTNLLDSEWTNRRGKEKVPISKKRTTNNFD